MLAGRCQQLAPWHGLEELCGAGQEAGAGPAPSEPSVLQLQLRGMEAELTSWLQREVRCSGRTGMHHLQRLRMSACLWEGQQLTGGDRGADTPAWHSFSQV